MFELLVLFMGVYALGLVVGLLFILFVDNYVFDEDNEEDHLQ